MSPLPQPSLPVIPHCAPPVWPEVIGADRFASTIRIASPEGCTFGLIGLADDLGVGLNNGRVGAREGPRAFRNALATYGVINSALDIKLSLFDAGDIIPAEGSSAESLHETHRRVSEATTKILELGLLPLAIGGGHDLTFPFVRAVIEHHRKRDRDGTLGGANRRPGGARQKTYDQLGRAWHGIYADAHLDVRDTVGSGMPFRRLIETCNINSLRVLGMEPLVNSPEHQRWFHEHGGRATDLTSLYDHLRAISKAAQPEGIFCSIDLDAIDSSHAPGVSATNPSGMTPREVELLLHSVAQMPALCCVDFMELCPPHDVSGRTSRLAARLFLSFLRARQAFCTRAGSSAAKMTGLPPSLTTVTLREPSQLTSIIMDARVLTLAQNRRNDSLSGKGSPGSVTKRRGPEQMNDLGVIPRGSIVMRGGRIVEVISDAQLEQNLQVRFPGAAVYDAKGRVVMPAFVDCHTHSCFAGNRLDEWTQRLRGTPYLEILAQGGGIMSTVRAVRAASQRQLTEQLLERLLHSALAEGSTSIEVKSGYGLTTRDELKMLAAIHSARDSAGMYVQPTALIGHAIDPAEHKFVRRVIEETLPAIHAEYGNITIDAYCEQSAWSLEDCRALYEKALELGHPCRVHADQFNDLGMTLWAAEHGFVSVDHLEASTQRSLEALAASDTIGVGLPICGLHMGDNRFAPLRRLVDLGGACAIATNFNPGTSFSLSMPLAIGMAVRNCGLTVAEAITAATINAAAVLGFPSGGGSLEVGQQADVIVLAHTDERQLAYQLGGQHVNAVYRLGTRIG